MRRADREPLTHGDFRIEQRFVREEFAKLDANTGKIAAKVVKIELDLQEVKTIAAAGRNDIQIVIGMIDSLTQKVEVFEKKAFVQDHRIQELESKFGQHDTVLQSHGTAFPVLRNPGPKRFLIMPESG